MRKSTVLRLRERYFKNKKAATIEETSRIPFRFSEKLFRLVGMPKARRYRVRKRLEFCRSDFGKYERRQITSGITIRQGDFIVFKFQLNRIQILNIFVGKFRHIGIRDVQKRELFVGFQLYISPLFSK